MLDSFGALDSSCSHSLDTVVDHGSIFVLHQLVNLRLESRVYKSMLAEEKHTFLTCEMHFNMCFHHGLSLDIQKCRYIYMLQRETL